MRRREMLERRAKRSSNARLLVDAKARHSSSTWVCLEAGFCSDAASPGDGEYSVSKTLPMYVGPLQRARLFEEAILDCDVHVLAHEVDRTT